MIKVIINILILKEIKTQAEELIKEEIKKSNKKLVIKSEYELFKVSFINK